MKACCIGRGVKGGKRGREGEIMADVTTTHKACLHNAKDLLLQPTNQPAQKIIAEPWDMMLLKLTIITKTSIFLNSTHHICTIFHLFMTSHYTHTHTHTYIYIYFYIYIYTHTHTHTQCVYKMAKRFCQIKFLCTSSFEEASNSRLSSGLIFTFQLLFLFQWKHLLCSVTNMEPSL